MARELYFTGEILEAAEAKRIGMVSKVVPHDELESETMEVASMLASGPDAGLRADEGEPEPDVRPATWGRILDQEALNMTLSGATMDHREAARAFVEKRAPMFTGE